jgi:hypothetical protein
MANDTQSQQESLMKVICENSMCAAAVFAPDRQSKSRGQEREPADLVWAWNDCVLLIYMMEKKFRSDDAGNKRAFRKAQGHNLSQAQGWMRRWPKHPLTGRNNYGSFSIPFNKDATIAVLSVVKTEQPFAELHDDLAEKLGIQLCATLPQSVIEQLFAKGGTAFDLHLMMTMLRGLGALPEAQALQLLAAYFHASWKACNLPTYPPEHSFHEKFDHSMKWLLGMRRLVTPAQGTINSTPEGWLGLLSDFSIIDLYKISKSVALGTIAMRSHGASVIGFVEALRHYDIGVCILKDLSDVDFARVSEIYAEWEAKYKAGEMRPGFVFTTDTVFGAGMFALNPIIGPSHLKRRLGELNKSRVHT